MSSIMLHAYVRTYPGLLTYGVQNGLNALPSNPPKNRHSEPPAVRLRHPLACALSPVPGWVGFGIAESGSMKGADIVYFEAATMKLVPCICNAVCAGL